MLSRSKIVFSLLFILSTALFNGQGFEWEYSVRMPFHVSTVYLGLIGGFSGYYHTGDIQQIEKQILCIDYTNGIGKGANIGIIGEWWFNGDMSLSGSLSYTLLTAEFEENSPPVPIEENVWLISKYSLYAKLPSISVGVFAKKRISGTYGWVGIGIDTRMIVSQEIISAETIVSPNGRVFSDGSQIRKFDDDLVSFRKLTLSPQLQAGYDAPLGNGIYISPKLYVNFPFMNNSNTANWRIWSYGANVALLLGL